MGAELCLPTEYEVDEISTSCNADPKDSTAFTVPSDCDCLVITFGGFNTSGIPTLTGLTWDYGGADQAMTEAVSVNTGNIDIEFQFYVLNPTTGNQTLRIDWASNPVTDTFAITAVYLKNIDATGTVVDTDVETGGTTHTHALTGASTDIAVSAIYSYDSTPTVSAGTLFTSGSIANGSGCSDSSRYASAYDDSGSPFGITYTNVTSSYSASVSALYKGTVITLEIEQEGFHFRDDDGNETGASFRGAQDSNITEAKSTNMRLRMLLDATGNPDSNQYQLEWKKSGDADSEYRAV